MWFLYIQHQSYEQCTYFHRALLINWEWATLAAWCTDASMPAFPDRRWFPWKPGGTQGRGSERSWSLRWPHSMLMLQEFCWSEDDWTEPCECAVMVFWGGWSGRTLNHTKKWGWDWCFLSYLWDKRSPKWQTGKKIWMLFRWYINNTSSKHSCRSLDLSCVLKHEINHLSVTDSVSSQV